MKGPRKDSKTDIAVQNRILVIVHHVPLLNQSIAQQYWIC